VKKHSGVDLMRFEWVFIIDEIKDKKRKPGKSSPKTIRVFGLHLLAESYQYAFLPGIIFSISFLISFRSLLQPSFTLTYLCVCPFPGIRPTSKPRM